jgi:hypothetical protein
MASNPIILNRKVFPWDIGVEVNMALTSRDSKGMALVHSVRMV